MFAKVHRSRRLKRGRIYVLKFRQKGVLNGSCPIDAALGCMMTESEPVILFTEGIRIRYVGPFEAVGASSARETASEGLTS